MKLVLQVEVFKYIIIYYTSYVIYMCIHLFIFHYQSLAMNLHLLPLENLKKNPALIFLSTTRLRLIFILHYITYLFILYLTISKLFHYCGMSRFIPFFCYDKNSNQPRPDSNRFYLVKHIKGQESLNKMEKQIIL